MSQPLASFQISSSFQDLLNTVFHSIPKILVFLFILIIGWFVATASIVLVALGAIAALKQVGIAATVTQPILYTVLVTCGAISAIGVGGGLIKPMQARWERMLTAAERDTGGQFAAYQQTYQQTYQQAYQQGRADAVHATQGQDQPPGPRCLQSRGFSRGAGYLHNPGYPPVQETSTETVVLDDPDNYPGGQYM
ncbi:MAG TPA: hypothetical protein VMI73_09875 [Trebonia sp.]|nr:hypothetical protein [Trebonia sp.]